MSGYSQNKDENMFQHKGAGKQEVGQSSERGLSCKSHISAHVWVLSSPKRSTEIGLRNGIESLSVKFGSSLKFKNTSVPLEARELYLISSSSEYRTQRKSTHCSRVYSPVPLLCCALLSHFVSKSPPAQGRSGQLFCTQGVCAEAPHMFHMRNRVRESGLGCSNQAGTALLAILTAGWAVFNTLLEEFILGTIWWVSVKSLPL